MAETRVLRHARIDRLLHWLMAVAVLVLLATGFLPALGLKFDWVVAHWVAGVALIGVFLVHLGRVAWRRSAAQMLVRGRDFGALRGARDAAGVPLRPGKYTLAQKAMHNVVAVAALVAMVSGALLLRKIDLPIWRRDPYWLEAATWGRIYVLHDLAALGFVSLVVLHVYFALRPEKRAYLRAMLSGWMSEADYRAGHDPAAWQPERVAGSGHGDDGR